MDWLEESKEEILSRLIDEYGNEIKRIAYIYVKDEKLAEDIVQETFLSCYQHLEKFRGESNYKTWLIKIAINKSKDTLRRWSFRNLVLKPTDKIRKIDSHTPEIAFNRQDEQELLIDEVLKLPIKLREVIILFYYKDYSIEEISSILQLTKNTVKTRLFRARNKLSQHLKGRESEWNKN